MENASKALIIAGGVLLAMMILALLLYVASSVTDMAEAQDRKVLTEQIEEFNKSYLAYNKKRMYGTDVITVVNKAIDHNKRTQTDEEEYHINIILTVHDTFETTKQTITTKADGTVEEGAKEKITSTEILKEGKTYKLLKGTEENATLNEEVVKFFNNTPTEDNIDEEKVGSTIVVKKTYSALTNFKRAIFSCTDVEYDENTGRVNSMTFEQI